MACLENINYDCLFCQLADPVGFLLFVLLSRLSAYFICRYAVYFFLNDQL